MAFHWQHRAAALAVLLGSPAEAELAGSAVVAVAHDQLAAASQALKPSPGWAWLAY